MLRVIVWIERVECPARVIWSPQRPTLNSPVIQSLVENTSPIFELDSALCRIGEISQVVNYGGRGPNDSGFLTAHVVTAHRVGCTAIKRTRATIAPIQYIPHGGGGKLRKRWNFRIDCYLSRNIPTCSSIISSCKVRTRFSPANNQRRRVGSPADDVVVDALRALEHPRIASPRSRCRGYQVYISTY